MWHILNALSAELFFVSYTPYLALRCMSIDFFKNKISIKVMTRKWIIGHNILIWSLYRCHLDVCKFKKKKYNKLFASWIFLQLYFYIISTFLTSSKLTDDEVICWALETSNRFQSCQGPLAEPNVSYKVWILTPPPHKKTGAARKQISVHHRFIVSVPFPFLAELTGPSCKFTAPSYHSVSPSFSFSCSESKKEKASWNIIILFLSHTPESEYMPFIR